MKYFIALLLLFSPFWAQAFTLECAGKAAGDRFKIESQEAVKVNTFGLLSFPENAAVSVTEVTEFQERHFVGTVIFSGFNGITKHGRMAHYIFKLTQSYPVKASFPERLHSLVLSVNGIDAFDNRYECFWP